MNDTPVPAGCARCELCGDLFPAETVLDHFRLLHPDVEFMRWPDGEVVIEVEADCIEPDDFK